MGRFNPDRYYRTDDPALAFIAKPQTLAKWRHEGRGPRYVKMERRVVYRGRDLNEWLDRGIVGTVDQPAPAAA